MPLAYVTKDDTDNGEVEVWECACKPVRGEWMFRQFAFKNRLRRGTLAHCTDCGTDRPLARNHLELAVWKSTRT